MKKNISIVILTLVVVGGLVFGFIRINNELVAHREIEAENHGKSIQKPLTVAEKNAELKKWEASPDGLAFKKWESSPEGKKVYAAEAKIMQSIKDNTSMEAVVTSLSLPEGSRVGFGMMVQIEDEEYILSFGIEQPGNNSLNLKREFDLLRTLHVNDKISLKSKNVSHAPKYVYPIVTGDYLERDGEIIYKRTPRKGGC